LRMFERRERVVFDEVGEGSGGRGDESGEL
jgi:hypothetical protein